MQYGIAIRNVCVRTEPTMEPLRKREGDVWDRRQESRINIGETMRVKRLDAGWMYVSSDVAEGYAKEEGIFVCRRNRYERYCKLLRKEFQVVIKQMLLFISLQIVLLVHLLKVFILMLKSNQKLFI